MPFKPGYKTTEFLITVATTIGLILASSASWLPAKYAALGSAVSVGAYAIARGLAKITIPPVPPAPPKA